ncbi:MAG TPA: chemotaxis protein CheW [Sphingobium sp.]
MNESLFLFATVAGTDIAMPTHELEAVVRLGEIVPIARTAPQVRGLAALRSRVLTIVDVRTLITGELTEIARSPLAIVAEVEGHTYGLLIDNVSDICPVDGGILPVRGRISAAWEPYAGGMILYEDRLHLAVSIPDFLRQPTLAAAA